MALLRSYYIRTLRYPRIEYQAKAKINKGKKIRTTSVVATETSALILFFLATTVSPNLFTPVDTHTQPERGSFKRERAREEREKREQEEKERDEERGRRRTEEKGDGEGRRRTGREENGGEGRWRRIGAMRGGEEGRRGTIKLIF